MEYLYAIADSATPVAIAWLSIATLSSLVDAFYVSTTTPKPLNITKDATRTKFSRKTFINRFIQFSIFISTTLLILSTAVLALDTVVATPPQVLVAPVQIRVSDREQIYKDMARWFMRDFDEGIPVPVPVPPQTDAVFRGWLTSSSEMATRLSLLMPMAIICGTPLAIVSDGVNTNGQLLVLPLIMIVACAAVSSISCNGLCVVFILSRAKWIVRIALAVIWNSFVDLLSPLIYCIESGLTSINYLRRLSDTPLLIRNVNSLIGPRIRHSSTSFLTQLLSHTFLAQYTVAIAVLLLVGHLVGVLAKRHHVYSQLVEALALSRCAAAAALIVLAIRLDPSSKHATKVVIEPEKDQENVPVVRGSPVAISPSSKNIPVDLSVFPMLGTGLMIDKGPKEICESNRSPLQTMMNDRRPERTCLVSIHPPSATVLAAIEDLLKDPTSALRGLPRNIKLTGSELIYVLMAVLEECNRRHQTVHDGLVKNNETAEVRIRSEARKYRALVLELNAAKAELECMRESKVEPKNIGTNAACMSGSVLHQIEDGKTASASRSEPAATPAHAGEVTTFITEEEITNLQGLLCSLRALRNLARVMLMPEHCSELDKDGEIDRHSNDNPTPQPQVRDLIVDCDFAHIEISRVISLLAIQRGADSKRNYSMLKEQQAFREQLSDQVTELRKEYKLQVENLYQQLQREKTAHKETKAFNQFYLRLHAKREHSLKEEVKKRKGEVAQLRQDVSCLQRRVKDTEALEEELLRPTDFKEWIMQWFSKTEISNATGSLLEKRYRIAMKDLDKIIAQVKVLTTRSDLVNEHAEMLEYICSTLFNLDSDDAPALSTAISKDSRPVITTRAG